MDGQARVMTDRTIGASMRAIDEKSALCGVISAHVKRAALTGDFGTAIDAIEEAVDEELACQREQVRDDCGEGRSIPVPLDRDGVPVMPDDGVWGEDGVRWWVLGLRGGSHPVCAVREGADRGASGFRAFRSERLAHHAPDTASSLADEIVALADETDVDGDTCGELRSIARRLRALTCRAYECRYRLR